MCASVASINRFGPPHVRLHFGSASHSNSEVAFSVASEDEHGIHASEASFIMPRIASKSSEVKTSAAASSSSAAVAASAYPSASTQFTSIDAVDAALVFATSTASSATRAVARVAAVDGACAAH
eukprot:30294-Pelagococcus_subviridis.AAC.6